MFTGIFVKILSIVLLLAVGIVLILGIGTLFKGGNTSKKYSNKLMQLRVLLQFIAIILLIVLYLKDSGALPALKSPLSGTGVSLPTSAGWGITTNA